MGYLAVIIAAAAAFAFGALWYSIFAKPWMADSRVPLGPNGRPGNANSAAPYLICFVAQIFVAGMMRLMLARIGVDGVWNAAQWGGAVGLFFVMPWIALNNGYAMRPVRLTAIDGGYATLGCAIMAAILWWLAPGIA